MDLFVRQPIYSFMSYSIIHSVAFVFTIVLGLILGSNLFCRYNNPRIINENNHNNMMIDVHCSEAEEVN